MPDYLPIAEALRTTLPEWFPVPSRARLQRIRGQLDVILLELISERKAALEAPSAAAMAPQDDLLTRLMRSRDDAGGMTDAALRDEAMTLFLAGHETTALALTYALWLLSLHPAEEQSLRRELGHVLGGRTPTTEDLPALPYARAVVDEALRLYPPAWAFGREPFAALDLLGVHVPLGTQVLVSPWVMHRDPRFFEQPDRFWPERWFGPPPPRFTYLPFGAGPRVCIGQHFAIAEAVLLLATLVQRAHFSREPASPLRLMAAVTLRPKDPVMMRAEAPPTI
jgi:cytochrome P450